MVELVYTLKFICPPSPPPPPPSLSSFRDHSYESVLLREIQTYPSMEVPVSFRGKGLYSCYFLILKAKRDQRPILDIRQLNKFLKKTKFQVVIRAPVIPSLDPEDWSAALDLKLVFYVVICQRHKHFLSDT